MSTPPGRSPVEDLLVELVRKRLEARRHRPATPAARRQAEREELARILAEAPLPAGGTTESSPRP